MTAELWTTLAPIILPSSLIILTWLLKSYSLLNWKDWGVDLIINSLAIHIGFFLLKYRDPIWSSDGGVIIWLILFIGGIILLVLDSRLIKLSDELIKNNKKKTSIVIGAISLILGLLVFIAQIILITTGGYS